MGVLKNYKNYSRRKFLIKSTLSVTALVSIPAIVSSCIASDTKTSTKKNSIYRKGDTILFQGDSITDAGREKKKELANNSRSFGSGYAFLAASSLLNSFPEKNLSIYNRGISGNKVYQLSDRWEKDCLDLKPDILSILIGVNDYWHFRNGKYNGTVEIYKNDYRKLLERTIKVLPNVKLVVCEPFYVLNTNAVDESWVKPMKEYQVAAHSIAKEFNTIWVPFQKVYDKAVTYAPATYWTGDGVHPAMPGAQLMAEAWLRAVE
ncbi:MAG: SGNH/GDSL hydrolase family protein [Flavobacteriaceae bacterium]|nr:SGNH/GDSL hydrolase family protein [Flavobacteriaceae bacterium]